MHDKAFCNLCAEMDEITFALKNNQQLYTDENATKFISQRALQQFATIVDFMTAKDNSMNITSIRFILRIINQPRTSLQNGTSSIENDMVLYLSQLVRKTKD